MPIAYFDSSAFVKLLVEEEGSDVAAGLWDGSDAAVSSRLAYPEVRAALAAAGRAGRLGRDDQRRAESAWEDFWAATRVVELSSLIGQRAGQLTGEHLLRGADAVHLASVLTVGASDCVLAVWDQRLRAGATAAGVQVVPDNDDADVPDQDEAGDDDRASE
jgi:predicted nucleic acid-binding protein